MVFFSQAFFYVDTQLVKAKNRLQNGNKRKTFFKKLQYCLVKHTEIRTFALAKRK